MDAEGFTAPINPEISQTVHTTETDRFEEGAEILVNMTTWFKAICWAGFLAYFFAAIGSFGHFMQKSPKKA